MTVKMTLCPRFMALLSAACSGLPCLFIPMTDINIFKRPPSFCIKVARSTLATAQ